MINSIAASRRLAVRMVAWQVIAILATAAVFLLQDRRAALAAGLGGCLIVLGTALMALRVFGAGHRSSASMALADLIGGMVLKWLVILVGLYVLLARWQMPGLAVLAGMGAAMAVNLLALRFKEQA
ncbi:MAG: ATP synthase subunit I [Rhodanobacter sp.]